MSPFNKGYTAYEDGWFRGENPYDWGTSEYNEWMEGWQTAESDCTEWENTHGDIFDWRASYHGQD